MSDWQEMSLNDIAYINPRESLGKGASAKKVAMELLQPFTKKIPGYSIEEYTGGMKFRNGDTLVARITPSLENGKTAFVDILNEGEVAFGSTEFIVLRAKENQATENFIYYLARSPEFRDVAILSMTGSSGRQRVQTDVVSNYLFDIPPLAEQEAITAVLSSLDDKIDLLHRQNKTLEALAQTLFRHWFIDNADDHWEDGCLGDLIELQYGKGLKSSLRTGERYPVVGSSGIVDFHSDYLVEAPGIVIGRKGTLGEVIYLSENFFPIDTTYYIKSKSFSPNLYFEYFLLKTINFKDMNTDSAVPGLNRSIALATEIIIPPQNKISRFNEFVHPIFGKIQKNEAQIRTLEKLRDTLLPKLMSGEVRVSNAPLSFVVEDVPGLFERMGVVETPYPVPAPMESVVLAEEKVTYQTDLSDAGLCFLETLHQWEQTSSTPIIGKTIAQKTGYVLKDVGVKMESEFVRGKNGPFSADFAETLKSLQSAGFLRQQPHRRRPIIVVHTEPQYAAQREQFASRLASFKPMIDKTFALVKCFRNKNHAEYVGTVLFVARELDKERGFIAREDVVSQVIKWKPHWFTESRTKNINEAIDFLVEMGFVELA